MGFKFQVRGSSKEEVEKRVEEHLKRECEIKQLHEPKKVKGHYLDRSPIWIVTLERVD